MKNGFFQVNDLLVAVLKQIYSLVVKQRWGMEVGKMDEDQKVKTSIY